MTQMMGNPGFVHIAEVNLLRIHYADEGAPGGLPVVFANSLGTDLRVWDAVLPHLPAGLRLVRYDKRGHGLSDTPTGPLSVQDLAADAAGLMDALGIRRAVFVGLSIGGLIGQALAAARPDLVRALVLANTAAKVGTAELWQARIAAVREGGIEGIADAILERWFSPAFRATRRAELAGWRNMLTRTPADGYVACCEALAAADLRGLGLDLPVLAVAGSQDGATPPELVRATAAAIPGSRYALIEGVGHIPPAEAPERLGVLIGEFLRENRLV